ncbi:MAG: hypothetical protein KDL87_16305, partial [Verrucomicrobiae bacterium]|nr:hypothetical protein [Verrucomicrobiae bacterium]
FGETAAALRDALVRGSGFEREEAADFVAAKKTEQTKLDFHRGPRRVVFTPVSFQVPEALDTTKLSPELKKKVHFSPKKKELEIKAPLSEEETEELQQAAVMDDTRDILRQAGEHSRTKAVEVFTTPSELGKAFFVPQMEVWIDGELRLFDEPEAIDYPWELPLYRAAPTPDQIAQLTDASRMRDGGYIDIDDEKGRMTTRYAKELQRDLSLAYTPEHWTEAKLAAWFCRQIHDPTITHASKTAFVASWLAKLLEQDGIDLARANQQKFLLRNLLAEQVIALRKEAIQTACDAFLFGEDREERVRIGTEYQFEFHPDAYAPDRDYRGEYGEYEFEKHYYPRMGDFRLERGIRMRLLDRPATGGDLLGAQSGQEKRSLVLPAKGGWPILPGLHLQSRRRAHPGSGIQGEGSLERRQAGSGHRRAMGGIERREVRLCDGDGEELGSDPGEDGVIGRDERNSIETQNLTKNMLFYQYLAVTFDDIKTELIASGITASVLGIG